MSDRYAHPFDWGTEYEIDSKTVSYTWGLTETEAKSRAHASPTDTRALRRSEAPSRTPEEQLLWDVFGTED